MKSITVIDHELQPAEPLWGRVPTRDEYGKPLSDFMLLIPGLRGWPSARRRRCVECLQRTLAVCPEVVFADLNLRLNVLWVSVYAQPGSCGHVAATLCERVPEAKLVSHHPEHFRR